MQGDPTLHALFAHSYWAIEDYENAHRHFLRSDDMNGLSDMLLEWAKTGYPSELDLFICRSVLLYATQM